jgi:hypothetical protein
MEDIRLYLETAPNAEAECIHGLLAINYYGSARKCVDFLCGLAGPDHTCASTVRAIWPG